MSVNKDWVNQAYIQNEIGGVGIFRITQMFIYGGFAALYFTNKLTY